jgi:hypothetical protein
MRGLIVLGALAAACSSSPSTPDAPRGAPDGPPPDATVVQGTVYERAADAGHTLATPPVPPVANAALSVTWPGFPDAGPGSPPPAPIFNNADGSFRVPVPSLPVVTIAAAAPGFALTWVTDEWAKAASAPLTLGLYREQPVTARPGFVKGVFTWDAGGWTVPVFWGRFASTYTRLHDVTHANLVAFADTPIVTAYGADSVTMATDADQPGAWPMLTAAQVQTLVSAAHARGLGYFMLLSVNGLAASYVDDMFKKSPGDTAFWDAWFAAYQAVVVTYAGIAKDNGVEVLGLSLGLGYVTRLPASRWANLVAAVRATGYAGKLVVVTYNFPDSQYEELQAANGGTPAPFVELFDAIVVSMYELTTSKTWTRRDLRAYVIALVEHARASGAKKIWLMLGTPSTDTGVSESTFIEPLVLVNDVANHHARDLYQQADAYQAALEVVNALPVGEVSGLLSWGYHYRDDYTIGMDPGDLAMDKSGNVRGKPAEAVLSWWFDRL